MAADRSAGAPPPPPTEAQLRDIMARGEQLRQQLSALEAQRDLLVELSTEARRALESLEHLATAKEGDEALLPLGAGTFIHARLAQPDRAIASLGSSLHAEVPVADARARMQGRVESLDSAMSQVGKEIGRFADELGRLNAFLEQTYGGA